MRRFTHLEALQISNVYFVGFSPIFAPGGSGVLTFAFFGREGNSKVPSMTIPVYSMLFPVTDEIKNDSLLLVYTLFTFFVNQSIAFENSH